MKRGSHAGKAKSDRENYTRIINRLESEPTVNDSLAFSPSDRSDRDLPVQETHRPRPEDFPEKLSRYIKKYWVHWVVTAAVAIVTLLAGLLTRDVGRLEGRVESFERGMRDNSEAIRDLSKKMDDRLDHQQKEIVRTHLELREISVRLLRRK